MGQSTDAILFYGFHGDEGDWEEARGDDDWETAYATKKGTPEPSEPYDTKEHKAIHRAFWEVKQKLIKAEPCELDSHCSGECPMPFVCVKTSKSRAYRGWPKEITSLAIDPEWNAQLKAFCDLMGIPWQEPKWWLVSDWN